MLNASSEPGTGRAALWLRSGFVEMALCEALSVEWPGRQSARALGSLASALAMSSLWAVPLALEPAGHQRMATAQGEILPPEGPKLRP